MVLTFNSKNVSPTLGGAWGGQLVSECTAGMVYLTMSPGERKRGKNQVWCITTSLPRPPYPLSGVMFSVGGFWTGKPLLLRCSNLA